MLRRSYSVVLVLIAGLFLIAVPASAQKAGKIMKFVAPAFIEQPGARPGLKLVSTPTIAGADIHWMDVLRTDEGGRIRAQLNDGSILSIGSKSKLTVNKHDEKAQQSSF